MDSTQWREAVNTLAMRAKTDRAAMSELWSMTEGLIKDTCGRYCRSIYGHTQRYEYEDLCQIAFFGFLRAIDKYDPSKGSFSTILVFCIRGSCRAEIKRYKTETDPMNAAASLDESLPNTEDFTLADTLPDPYAHKFIEEISLHSVAQVILDEADKLNPLHTYIIREVIYSGRRTLASLADELGVTTAAMSEAQRRAVFQLRHRATIRALAREFLWESQATKRDSATDPFRRKSLTAFKRDFTSVVEAVVLRGSNE